MEPFLWTIGHSAHSADYLIELLEGQGIARVVDVRSVPYSRRHPQHGRERLQASLEARGIDYRWAGEALGGKRDMEAARVSESFQKGLSHLAKLAEETPTAIMCAEEDPRHCHRLHLICAEWAPRYGEAIRHIRKGRRVESHKEVVGQGELFG
jgi:uncharacterized protein (DUF488 family)